jgi:fatty-acyl-CoA synthase
MHGLMMNYQLTLPSILRRAEELHGPREIVSRNADRSVHRYTYADFVPRAKRLALALRELGVKPGERVGTFCWNHYQHLEAYFGIPAAGAVLHTLNLRLHPNDLTYIVNHADDKVILVDQSLYPLFERFRSQIQPSHVIVVGAEGNPPAGTLDYEALLGGFDAGQFRYPEPDENAAAAMCYTSGTTGRPKAVLYSHRALFLHSLGQALPDSLGMSAEDVILPVVPMFHANAWGFPFTGTLVGAKQVFPGPFLDGASLLELFANERVTLTGGVPTIWLGILQVLDKEPKKYDLSALRAMAVGGSAAPESMIRAFQERHGLTVLHAWGMTEMSPLGTVSRLTPDLEGESDKVKYDYRAKQGRPSVLVEIRVRNDNGIAPWDGTTMGELEVRGPWVASAYYNSPGSEDRFTEDGWFKTGDIATIDSRGYMKIQDRSKDVIKSGGEWISSVDLENALMGHPAVAEAAVIAIPDARWAERPLAAVVLKEGQAATADELRDFLAPNFAKWWLPDHIVFVDQIPKTAVGKFLKSALRERFQSYGPAPT